MNNMSLYDLSANYLQALDTLTDPELDLPMEAIADTLEALEGELQDKAVNVAKYMKNMEAMIKAIKEAEQNMARRRQTLENRAQWLKDYLKGNMEACGFQKIESPWFRLAIQKNPASVNVFDENAVPTQFKKEVVTIKIDKTAIKNAIKSGEDVPGAKLMNGSRLAIK